MYLHFLIAPAGFLGQRLPLVSMAGFVRTPRTEGGTKGPQWTCHSPASKAPGGAGQGHRARGHRSLYLHQHRVDVGSPRGRARGWLVADAHGTPMVRALPEQRWAAPWALGQLDGGPSAGGGSHPTPIGSGARARPRCSLCSHFPLFSASFPPTSGGFLSPSHFPTPFRHCCACPAPDRAAKTRVEAWEQAAPEALLQAQCHRAEVRLQAASL